MQRSGNKPHGIFVLPPILRSGAISDADKRWLSRGSLEYDRSPVDAFETVLSVLGIELPDAGSGALRLWGQTGDRPTVWIAAADPVCLAARMTRVHLHAFDRSEVSLTDLRGIFDYLQQTLGGDASIAFARVGRYGYVRGKAPMATAARCAVGIDGQSPEAMMPEGKGAETYHRLLSEVQMSLHEHEINLRRENEGQRPINSIWIWGGGVAPEPDARPIPPLFANDPLLRGYWYSCRGVTERWSGNFEEFAELAVAGFVAVSPNTPKAGSAESITSYFAQLRRLYASGNLRRMTLIFRDGLTVEIRPRDRFRFWCRISPRFRNIEQNENPTTP